MKKGIKILLITLGVLIVLLFTLWATRNIILTRVFEKVVPMETSGKVHIGIKALTFNFFEHTISIDSLEVNFSSIYLDKEKNTEFKKIVFGKVSLENFKVFSLLLNNHLVAKRLIFSRPDIFIVTNGKESENKTNPEDLLNLIEHSSGENFGFLAHVGRVELRYGQIDVVDINDPTVKFYTESLTIYLDDFNSIDRKKWESGQMFFSNSVYLKVINLYKSFHNGYAFTIDSLTWFSGKYNLDAHGFSYWPVAKISDSAALFNIQAQSLLMNNFRLKGTGSANLATVNKLILNDGDLRIRQGYLSKKKSNNNDTVRHDDLFNMILADTLILNRNQLFISDNKGDTLIFFNNLNLKLEELKLDSLFFEAPEKHFNYSFFRFSTSAFISNKLVPGVHIQSKSISYNSRWNKFVLNEFLLKDSAGAFHFHSGRIKFNFSMRKLLRNEQQRVDIFMIRPFARIMLKEHSGENNSFLDNLKPGNVKVIHGTVKITTPDSNNIVKLQDFTFFSRKLRFSKQQQVFSYDSLYLNSKSFVFIRRYRFDIKGSNLMFNGNNFTGGHFTFADKVSSRNFELEKLNIVSLQPEKLLFNNELTAGKIELSKVVSSFVFDKKNEPESDSAFLLSSVIDKIEEIKSFKVDIGKLRVNSSSVKLKWNSKGKTSGFFTNYDLVWKNLSFGHDGDQPLSNVKGLEIKLWNSYYFANGIRTDIGKLNIKSDDGYFGLHNLKITQNDTALTDKFRIRDVSVEFVGLRNFGYHDLLNNNKVVFDKLFINGLTVDMEQHPKVSTDTVSAEPYSFNLKEKLPVDLLFDSVEVKNFHVNYISLVKQSKTKFAVKDFRFESSPLFRHNNKTISIAGLFNNSGVTLDSLQISNPSTGFRLTVKSSNLNPFSKTLLLTGLDLELSDKQNRQNKTVITNDTLTVSGIMILDSMPAGVNMRGVRFSNTRLKIFNHNTSARRVQHDTVPKLAGLYRFSKLLKSLAVDTILFENMNIDYRDTVSPKKSWKVDNLRFKVNNFKLIPEMARDTLPVSFGNIFAEVKNRKFITGDSLYEISIERISFNSSKKSFLIDSLYVTPLLDTIPFFTKHRWQTDRINFFVPEAEFSGFDLERWNSEGVVHFRQIEAQRPVAYLYRDRSFPRDSLIRPLLQRLLLKIKQPFAIDSVFINNAYLQYSQKDIKSEKPGHVYFTDFNLKAYNISNRWNYKKRTLAKIFVDGRLMGEAKMELNLYVPLTNNQIDQFWFTAKSEKVDLTTLNPMTQNLSGLTIMSGKGTLDIPLVTANDTLAVGSMLFKYRKLKVSLYNRNKTKKTGGISSPLINFVVNNLVLRSNNPALFKRPRVGIVYFKRDRNKSIVNYVWKSTLSGVLSTMGFNNKEQRKRRKEYRKQEFDVQRNAVKEEKYGKE